MGDRAADHHHVVGRRRTDSHRRRPAISPRIDLGDRSARRLNTGREPCRALALGRYPCRQQSEGGIATTVRVAHADSTLDRLTVNGLDGNDTITAGAGRQRVDPPDDRAVSRPVESAGEQDEVRGPPSHAVTSHAATVERGLR
jgi:hypothetical protein